MFSFVKCQIESIKSCYVVTDKKHLVEINIVKLIAPQKQTPGL
jgi:hypothetical protein